MRRLLINTAIGLIAVAIVVVIVDLVAFYVLDIKPNGYRADRFFEFSPQFGHEHRPGYSGDYYRYLMGEKHAVSINEHGYADAERTVEKTRPRIALIGDSTTEFWEVDAPQRGQHVLEERLDGRFEVLNMGVRGYGTDQSLLLFAEKGVRFSPDVVVYTFCINDIADNARKKGKPWFEFVGDTDSLVLHNQPVETPRGWDDYGTLYERSFVYRLFRVARNRLMPGIRIKRMLGRFEPPRPHFELRCYLREYNDAERERMDRTLALISKMNDFMAERGMRFLVVEGIYKPMANPRVREKVVAMYGDKFDPDKVSEILSSHCEREGIPFVSLPRIAHDTGIAVSSLMNSSDNMHLDADGVRFFADSVADEIERLGWSGERR